MNTLQKLFASKIQVVNIGLEQFASTLRAQNVPVVQLAWKPPAGGDEKDLAYLDQIKNTCQVDIAAANSIAVKRILDGRPYLIGVGKALDHVPGMTNHTILHAGPPLSWHEMCGPLRGAIIGALLYEGMAANKESAEALAASGDIHFDSCHHHQAVGPMAGVLSPHMPVWIMENKSYKNLAYCSFNEGLGKVLRYGAFSPDVLSRLTWLEKEFAPLLQAALMSYGPLDISSVIAQALQMGDEGHNRNRAGTSLIIRELAPHIVTGNYSEKEKVKALSFMHSNDHFFLNLSMAACKCTADAARDIQGSTIVVAMARNGTHFGIQISGLGTQWFTGPASMVDGLYLPGFGPKDAAPDIGDSVITETVGLGGFAMAAAPAIVQFVGGRATDAITITKDMYEICIAESNIYRIPALDFSGSPTGIDLCKVVETGILPAINTGIAHKEAGIGMVGAGLVKPPRSCFQKALKAFAEKYCKGKM